MKLTLSKVEELHSTTKNGKGVYQGCLSVQERQKMAEIYASARLRPVKVTAKNASRKFNTIRKEFV
jgi:hypothetical protein